MGKECLSAAFKSARSTQSACRKTPWKRKSPQKFDFPSRWQTLTVYCRTVGQTKRFSQSTKIKRPKQTKFASIPCAKSVVCAKSRNVLPAGASARSRTSGTKRFDFLFMAPSSQSLGPPQSRGDSRTLTGRPCIPHWLTTQPIWSSDLLFKVHNLTLRPSQIKWFETVGNFTTVTLMG